MRIYCSGMSSLSMTSSRMLGQPGKPEQPAWCSSPLRSILNHQPLLRDCLFKGGEEQESQIRQDVSSNFPEHLILGLLLDMNMSRKWSLANNWHQAAIIKKENLVTSLVFQWPGPWFYSPSVGGPGSILAGRTRSHMLQLSLGADT